MALAAQPRRRSTWCCCERTTYGGLSLLNSGPTAGGGGGEAAERAVARPGRRGDIPAPMRAAGALLLVATSLSAAPLAAQTASPYVPLGHWAMPFVEYLISSGVIADPTPLTRPLKQADLVLALEAADTIRLGGAAKATIRRLLREFRQRVRAPRYRVELGAGIAAASYTVRDPLELGRGVPPRQAVRRGFASGSAQVLLTFGPFVGG